MFSIITCSIQPEKFNAVGLMYQQVFAGTQWELIGIHDAKSLAEGYNRGVDRARGDVLIFAHDDIEVLSPRLPQRLMNHLEKFDLIGLAGTTRLIAPGWVFAGPPYIFGQVAHPAPDGPLINVAIYGVPRRAIGGIQALDGLFMACRRSLLNRIKFDELTFDGFHHYDTDFSHNAFRNGLRVGVVCDINLFHQSGGNYDEKWHRSAEKFTQKWLAHQYPLPARKFVWAGIQVATKAECLEIMNPTYWDEAR
jgi:GT2 family glycosyltransferase